MTDARKISAKWLAQQTVVEGQARDNGARLRVVVSGDKVAAGEPSGIVVVKGNGCDNMSFFSSKEAGEAWRKAHNGEGELFSLAAAVQRGATSFGRYATSL